MRRANSCSQGKISPPPCNILKTYLASNAMVEDAPAFRAHYLLGQLYEKMGNKSGAVSEYKSSLALASGFAPAGKALARLQ